MKKLFTLLLVLTGMVSTASAAKLYVNISDNVSWWSTLRVYAWNSEGNNGWSNKDFGIVTSSVTRFGKSWYAFDMGSYTSAVVQQGSVVDNTFKIYNKTYDITGLGTIDKYVIITSAGNTGEYTNDNNESKKPFTYGYYEAPAIRSNVDDNWLSTSSNMTEVSNNSLSYTFSKSSVDALSDGDIRFRLFDFGNQIYPSSSSLTVSIAGSTSDCTNSSTSSDNYYSITKPTYDYSTIVVTATYENSAWIISADAYVSVTTNSSGYATFVSGAPLTISGATAYYATDKGNGSATAHAITNPAANTPMLLKGTKADVDKTETLEFKVAATGTDNPGASNAFHAGTGTLDATDGGGYNYILKGDAFYLANSNNVATNKAYLKLTQPAQGRALKFFDNEETGISAITSTMEDCKTCYNLNGQRIANPSKGLFIRNGKKVLIK
jgi:hypothetical protein